MDVGKLDNEFRRRPVTAPTSCLPVIRPERSIMTRDPLVLTGVVLAMALLGFVATWIDPAILLCEE